MTEAERALIDAVLENAKKGFISDQRIPRQEVHAVLLEREDPTRRDRAVKAAERMRDAYAEYEATLDGLSPTTREIVHGIAWGER